MPDRESLPVDTVDQENHVSAEGEPRELNVAPLRPRENRGVRQDRQNLVLFKIWSFWMVEPAKTMTLINYYAFGVSIR